MSDPPSFATHTQCWELDKLFPHLADDYPNIERKGNGEKHSSCQSEVKFRRGLATEILMEASYGPAAAFVWEHLTKSEWLATE